MQNYDVIKYNHAIRLHINLVTSLILREHSLPVIVADTIINTMQSLTLPTSAPTIPRAKGLETFFRDNKLCGEEFTNIRKILKSVFRIYEEEAGGAEEVLVNLTCRLHALYAVIRIHTFTDIYIYGENTPRVSHPEGFVNVGVRDLIHVDSELFGGVALIDDDMWHILMLTIPKYNYKYLVGLRKQYVKIKKTDPTVRMFAKQEVLLPNCYDKHV